MGVCTLTPQLQNPEPLQTLGGRVHGTTLWALTRICNCSQKGWAAGGFCNFCSPHLPAPTVRQSRYRSLRPRQSSDPAAGQIPAIRQIWGKIYLWRVSGMVLEQHYRSAAKDPADGCWAPGGEMGLKPSKLKNLAGKCHTGVLSAFLLPSPCTRRERALHPFLLKHRGQASVVWDRLWSCSAGNRIVTCFCLPERKNCHPPARRVVQSPRNSLELHREQGSHFSAACSSLHRPPCPTLFLDKVCRESAVTLWEREAKSRSLHMSGDQRLGQLSPRQGLPQSPNWAKTRSQQRWGVMEIGLWRFVHVCMGGKSLGRATRCGRLGFVLFFNFPTSNLNCRKFIWNYNQQHF